LLWIAALLFTGACLLIGSRSGAWLEPGPRLDARTLPLVVEGGDLLACLPRAGKRAGPIRDGVRLYANTQLTFRAVTSREGTTRFSFLARGRPLHGVWPLLTLHVNGEYRGSFRLDWWYEAHALDLDLAPGEHHFRISYVNDRPGFPGRQDVDLRFVALGEHPDPGPAWPVAGQERKTPWNVAGPLQLSNETQVVTANGFDLDSGADSVDGARVLWSNGHLGRRVAVSESGNWYLVLKAKGDLCEGRGPRVIVLAGADQLARFDVDADAFEEYAVELPLRTGTHEIALAYVNDRRVPGVCDRNLRIAELRFEPGGPALGAEAE
jgi:hypothetical protein